jgi:DNA-binding ferritin-like protein (Dps family)
MNLIEKLIGSLDDKREWNRQAARVKVLPGDYRYAYKKIQHYLFCCGMSDVKMLYDLLNLFEMGVAKGKSVLEITGDDVAAFCDEIIRNANTYSEDWRKALNSDIASKLGKGRDSK